MKRVLLLLTLTSLLFSCKKSFDDYYEAPDNLSPHIYTQLEKRGNFTRFLALVDKAGYKGTLQNAGYWTLFAPTDSAFNTDASFTAFLQSRNIANFDAIDSATAQNIVQFLLVYNGFEKDRIDDYQSNLGYIADAAFKRRTAYYTGFYTDTNITGQTVKAIPSNRNNTGNISYFNPNDNNNKYIPYFTTEYLANNGLSSTADYSFFYPTSTFSGFNVANARVTEKDIPAGNGVIHIIDKVVTPISSIDQYLRTKPEYSAFRDLFERYMVLFIQNADATRRYQVLTGQSENILVKVYNSLLAYSPNSENWFKLQDNDTQREGWTMMAPRNDSLNNYINKVLLENYPSINSLPLNVIADLLNSHMWQSTLWPSKFTSTLNFLGEPAHISLLSNVVDKRVLSNGFFYGTNKVNEPNVFSTIYGKPYLNPNYSLTTRLLNFDLKPIITNPTARYTMFVVPDAIIRSSGFDFNSATNFFTFNGNGNDTNRLNLLRMLNTMLVETPNGELDQLGTPGFTGTGVVSTFGGEVIKYNGNNIISAGTADRNIIARIDSVKTASNGRVIYLNNLLYFTYNTVGAHIRALGTPTTSEYNLFWNYLRFSSVYDSVGVNVIGMNQGAFYTVLAPNNASMRAAITAGLLPGTAAVPNFNPSSTADKLKVQNFLWYHIIDKKTIIPDRKDIGNFPTLLKSTNGDPFIINVQYPGNVLEFSDQSNVRKARLVTALSNQLSNRAVIHLLDNYLKYP